MLTYSLFFVISKSASKRFVKNRNKSFVTFESNNKTLNWLFGWGDDVDNSIKIKKITKYHIEYEDIVYFFLVVFVLHVYRPHRLQKCIKIEIMVIISFFLSFYFFFFSIFYVSFFFLFFIFFYFVAKEIFVAWWLTREIYMYWDWWSIGSTTSKQKIVSKFMFFFFVFN